jgi:hypothetical protein
MNEAPKTAAKIQLKVTILRVLSQRDGFALREQVRQHRLSFSHFLRGFCDRLLIGSGSHKEYFRGGTKSTPNP